MAPTWLQHTLDDDALVGFMIESVMPELAVQRFNPCSVNRTLLSGPQIEHVLHPLVSGRGDITSALTELQRVPAVQDYMDHIDSDQRREAFTRQCQRHLSIHLPQCKFQLAPTYQYNPYHAQVAVVTRAVVQAGESIRFLEGLSVKISQTTVEQLEADQRAISLIDSDLKDCSFVLLSIARFVNHDCRPNAYLVNGLRLKDGATATSVIAKCAIPVNTEITVYYGAEYFGPDNSGCLCRTCEEGVANGWAARRSQHTQVALHNEPSASSVQPTSTHTAAVTPQRHLRCIYLPAWH